MSVVKPAVAVPSARPWQRRWCFLLLQRHRHDRLVLETIGGKSLLILPQVLHPVLFRTGWFLAECLDERLVPRGSVVLDMGTGSGVGAIFAAQWARRVVAVDVNLAAVRCARINALLNEVEEALEVCLGDLFTLVQGQPYIRWSRKTFRDCGRGARARRTGVSLWG